MIVLSHRGYWIDEDEKNSRAAFERSFSNGFGIETDVRDFNGHLVVSHDLPSAESMLLEDFFDLYQQYSTQVTLALNIKADGLQDQLERQLVAHEIEKYFVFDMAVPDGLLYLRRGIISYTRQSEYEPVPPYYDLADGIWLDEFDRHWINEDVIERHISAGKNVCIVSPELHKRSYKDEWKQYRNLERRLGRNDLMFLCTDYPELARGFFDV